MTIRLRERERTFRKAPKILERDDICRNRKNGETRSQKMEKCGHKDWVLTDRGPDQAPLLSSPPLPPPRERCSAPRCAALRCVAPCSRCAPSIRKHTIALACVTAGPAAGVTSHGYAAATHAERKEIRGTRGGVGSIGRLKKGPRKSYSPPKWRGSGRGSMRLADSVHSLQAEEKTAIKEEEREEEQQQLFFLAADPAGIIKRPCPSSTRRPRRAECAPRPGTIRASSSSSSSSSTSSPSPSSCRVHTSHTHHVHTHTHNTGPRAGALSFPRENEEAVRATTSRGERDRRGVRRGFRYADPTTTPRITVHENVSSSRPPISPRFTLMYRTLYTLHQAPGTHESRPSVTMAVALYAGHVAN